MTNEEKLELIAQARELCERKIAEWQEVFDEVSKYSDAQHQRDEINSWATHLAEMDEHKTVPNEKYGDVECLTCEVTILPCLPLLTKAKRLLGVK